MVTVQSLGPPCCCQILCLATCYCSVSVPGFCIRAVHSRALCELCQDLFINMMLKLLTVPKHVYIAAPENRL